MIPLLFGINIGKIAKFAFETFVPGGSTITNVADLALKGGGGEKGCPPGFSDTTQGCLPTQTALGRSLRGELPLGPAPCPSGTVPDPQGRGFCVSPRSPVGRAARATTNGFGNAVMGQFGAALEPEQFQTLTRRCPRGAVLGLDGLCYNRRDLRNTERMWPRGTAPLLTGGDMRCIRIAARAGTKLTRKTKQLRAMGMMPALPKPRKAKALPPGHHAHVEHN